MSKPIKMSFTVEFSVSSEDAVVGVLSKLRVIRNVVRRLGLGTVSPLRMETPKREVDGLVVMLTEGLH